MYLDTGGYNDHQYVPEDFRRLVKACAEALPKIMDLVGAESVVVQGKSGQSLAFGMMMLIDFQLVVVRKNNEQSHGFQIEGMGVLGPWVFLDDFVSSGETLDRVMQTLSDRAGGDAPQCVGIIEASKSYGGDCTHQGIPRYWTNPLVAIGSGRFNTWPGRPVSMPHNGRAVMHEPVKHYESLTDRLSAAYPKAFSSVNPATRDYMMI